MFISIVIFPFLGAILSGFLGRKIGITGSQWICCSSLLISAVLSSIGFYDIFFKLDSSYPVWLNLGNWIESELLNVSWEFSFDPLSITFCIMITYITSLILIYTIYYLSGGPHVQRFFSYMTAFAGFMLLLVTGGNYFVMFVGWEGIGVISFLLISYYYTRIQAVKAGLLAFTMNRAGDMILSIAFFALFTLIGSVDYSLVFSLIPYLNENAITIIALLLFGGACAKSAQLPLFSWLPGSMEAPTPVSALLHAATLVTAGIFLLLRSSPILSYSSDALLIITLIGSLTAFIAGTTALVQNDLKRIIAFSTISQLGYMVIAIGLAQWNIALLHTVLHAFFKALLFLSAGVIIHSLNDEQDIRKMGGLIRFLPFTYSVMLIGTIALLGLPWLSGFYSKDLILELAYGKYEFSGFFAFVLGTITASLTAFYSVRLINVIYFTTPKGPQNSYLNIHSLSGIEYLTVILPLSILSLFAIFLGFICSDAVNLGSDFFGNSLFYHPQNIHIIEAEFSLPLYIKLLPTILSILGGVLAFYLYHYSYDSIRDLLLPSPINKNEGVLGRIIYTFLNSKYYLDIFYNDYIIKGGMNLGYYTSKLLDKGVIELVGPYGLSSTSYKASHNLSQLDTGVITTYALYITLGLISLLVLLFTPLFNIYL
jgi:NADH-ubiquinone oxidoreductase chain 5